MFSRAYFPSSRAAHVQYLSLERRSCWDPCIYAVSLRVEVFSTTTHVSAQVNSAQGSINPSIVLTGIALQFVRFLRHRATHNRCATSAGAERTVHAKGFAGFASVACANSDPASAPRPRSRARVPWLRRRSFLCPLNSELAGIVFDWPQRPSVCVRRPIHGLGFCHSLMSLFASSAVERF